MFPSYPSNSPNFRSMYSNRERSPLMNGLLSSSEPDMSASAPSLPPAPAADASQYASQAVTSPSRAQFFMRPARTEYAKTTPPQSAPQQVWRTPSGSALRYPQSAYDVARPPAAGVTAGLIDNPADTVAAPLDLQPPAMQPQPAALAGMASDEQATMPPFEAEFFYGNDSGFSARPAQYLDPITYQPLQPTRRYEVL